MKLARLAFATLMIAIALIGVAVLVMAPAHGAILFVEQPDGKVVKTEVPDAVLRTTCVMVNGAHLDIVGDLAVGEDGRVAWTGRQLQMLAGDLSREEMQWALMLRLVRREPALMEDFGDGPTPIPATPIADQARKLTPACGECLAGHTCVINNETECCDGTSGQMCVACKVCSPLKAVGRDAQ